MTGRLPIVTIDGPAGSGKSSTARAVATRLGFRHLDSGALYRALTLALLRADVEPERWSELSEADFGSLDVDVNPTKTGYDVLVDGNVVDAELRAPEVTALVSRAAAIPEVRARLLALQRLAGEEGGLVADGRDMGTAVFPHAEVKVFLVADVEERARRRVLDEGGAPDDDGELARQVAAIAERDARDSGRKASPLRRAEDAHDLDTTALTFDEQVDEVCELVRRLTQA